VIRPLTIVPTKNAAMTKSTSKAADQLSSARRAPRAAVLPVMLEVNSPARLMKPTASTKPPTMAKETATRAFWRRV
jgi:hypothetical protein